MSNPIAGWYPDPAGDLNTLRYWDGASWTEHYAPTQAAATPQATQGGAGEGAAAPQEPGAHGTTPGSGEQPTAQLPSYDQPTATYPAAPGEQHAGYGQQQAAQLGYGHQPVAQPSGYGSAPHDPYGQQPYPQSVPHGQQPGHAGAHQSYGQYPGSEQPYGHAPYAAPGQGPQQEQPGEPGGSGKGLVIGIIVAAAVLIAAAVVAVVLLLGGGDEDPDPGSGTTQTQPADEGPTDEPADEGPTDEPTDGPTDEPADGSEDEPAGDGGGGAVSGGELDLEGSVEASIAAGETWTATLSVSEATPVVIDAVAATGDLTLTVSGNGVQVENDDRSDFLDVDGAGLLDPAVALALEPGEYEVSVAGYGDSTATDFTVHTAVPTTVAPGETVSLETTGQQVWLGAIELEEAATVTLDMVSSEGDPVLGLFTSEGQIEGIDDSGDGAGSWSDPYLELELPAGTHVLSVHDYYGDPLATELSIGAE